MRGFWIPALAGVILLAGCGGDDTDAKERESESADVKTRETKTKDEEPKVHRHGVSNFHSILEGLEQDLGRLEKAKAEGAEVADFRGKLRNVLAGIQRVRQAAELGVKNEARDLNMSAYKALRVRKVDLQEEIRSHSEEIVYWNVRVGKIREGVEEPPPGRTVNELADKVRDLIAAREALQKKLEKLVAELNERGRKHETKTATVDKDTLLTEVLARAKRLEERAKALQP